MLAAVTDDGEAVFVDGEKVRACAESVTVACAVTGGVVALAVVAGWCVAGGGRLHTA